MLQQIFPPQEQLRYQKCTILKRKVSAAMECGELKLGEGRVNLPSPT